MSLGCFVTLCIFKFLLTRNNWYELEEKIVESIREPVLCKFTGVKKV